MAHFGHGSATPTEVEDPRIVARNTRLGLWLFAVYCLIYGGFVAINAFYPSMMTWTVLGVTLAIVYGLGLILAAFVLALVYAWGCQRPVRGGEGPQ